MKKDSASEEEDHPEKSTHDKLSAAGKKGAATRWGSNNQQVRYLLSFKIVF